VVLGLYLKLPYILEGIKTGNDVKLIRCGDVLANFGKGKGLGRSCLFFLAAFADVSTFRFGLFHGGRFL